jgi:hypothetical protein
MLNDVFVFSHFFCIRDSQSWPSFGILLSLSFRTIIPYNNHQQLRCWRRHRVFLSFRREQFGSQVGLFRGGVRNFQSRREAGVESGGCPLGRFRRALRMVRFLSSSAMTAAFDAFNHTHQDVGKRTLSVTTAREEKCLRWW